MTTKMTVAIALALTIGVGTTAEAQGRSHLGPHIGYNVDYDALVLGAQFGAPLTPQLEFYPSFDYYVVDAGKLWAINADLKYRVPFQGADWLYVGTGLNMTRRTVANYRSTDAGLNLFSGIETRAGNIHPFAEARLTVGNGSTVQVVAGLNFTLGSHQ